ncbi:MAG: ATP-binding protein [Candidatus Omnitrophica bacterium]|nr:ATP-binding protein [Candidatus Omnitrophota bacterium]
MKYIHRLQEDNILEAIKRDKSVLLLGARQTGKTTLINRLKHDLAISLVRPDTRQRYEKEHGLLAGEIEGLAETKKSPRPLVLIDEIQKALGLLDVAQDLIDRGIANFVFTGSSARKLYRGAKANLLPGRVINSRLDPFTLNELGADDLKARLLYGALPGIIKTEGPKNKEIDLESYVTTYLEEEVRAEALVRNLGSFARFLEYAASESGNIVNFRKLSQEIGVSHTTIKDYYQVLEDCLIVERVDPLTRSKTRKKLTKSSKYLFFDLGVRRVAAREGIRLPRDRFGNLFEQFVGLELIRTGRLSGKKAKVMFWRDPDGPEIDWVIECEDRYIPVEVKWTDAPSERDIKHLRIFMAEYKKAKAAYLICQTPRKVKLDNNIYAISWRETNKLSEC